MVNMTCPVAWEAPEDPKPFYRDGQLNFKAHDVGWIVCGVMALVATVSSIWLIWKHLTYYTQPSQQRHIVRLLIMVPIYAIVSFMSYLFYHEALYYQTIRDCYEAVLVTSFFYLLVSYTGDTRSEVHAVFRSLEVGKWVWPLGSWKYRPDGMHFLWIMKISVLQYAIVRPVCTLAAVGLEYFDLYCLASWMPWFGHVWCVTLISISVTVAMYCLIAFYYPIRHLVDPYKPILKFLAIKTIVFITFWQDTFLSFLVSFDVIKNTQYFSAEAIQVGINALLQCFWMMLFGFIHIKAFSYLPYRPADRARTTLRGRALLNVLDFRDWFWEMKDSTNYMRARRKGRNFTLAEDIRADRYAHLERALGRDRKAELEREMHLERSALKSYWKDPLDESHEGGGGGVVSSSSGTSGKGDAAPRGRRAGGGRGGGGGTRDMTDLEKLAAAVDEEDEADGLLSPSSPVPRSESAGRSLDYVARMYATDSDSHEDLYPELTMHHRSAPSIEIDHAASAAATDSGRGTRRKMDLSAVEEADEPIEPGRGGGAGGGAGVGAFGIAGWFGWNAYAQPVEQGETSRAQHADREKSLYLSADDGRSAAGAQPAPEASWWRSFRNRLSGSHSRGPSGNRDDEDDDDDDELEPLRAAAEAYGGGPGPGPGPTSATVHRLGQVAEGSWGSNRDLQGRYAAQQGDSMAAHSDAGSPTGPISPDVESPLSRLIQVHRDSLTTSERRLAQDALAASPSSERAVDDLAAAPIRRGPDASIPRPPKVSLSQLSSEKRANLAPPQPSVAPSSQQASIVPSESGFGGSSSAAALSRRPTTSTNAPSVSVSAPRSSSHGGGGSTRFVSAAGSLVAASSAAPDPAPAPPYVAVDDLPPIELPPLTKKQLPAASGPKGKPIKIVIPSPLSPARYPYGQEGEAGQQLQQPPFAAAPAGSATAAAAGAAAPSPATDRPSATGSIRFSEAPRSKMAADMVVSPVAMQPSRDDRRSSRPAPTTATANAAASTSASTDSKYERKGTVVIGSMSSAQWKAKQDAEEQQSRASRDAPVVASPVEMSKSPKAQREVSPTAAAKATAPSIPAPSQLGSLPAGLTSEDPFAAGQKVIQQEARAAAVAAAAAAAAASATSPSRAGAAIPGGGATRSSASRNTTTTSLGGTAFEVGTIVTRDQVAVESGLVRSRMMSYPPIMTGSGLSLGLGAGAGAGPSYHRPVPQHAPVPVAMPSPYALPATARPAHPYPHAHAGHYGPPPRQAGTIVGYGPPPHLHPSQQGRRTTTTATDRRVSAPPAPHAAPPPRRSEDSYTRLPHPSSRRLSAAAAPAVPYHEPGGSGRDGRAWYDPVRSSSHQHHHDHQHDQQQQEQRGWGWGWTRQPDPHTPSSYPHPYQDRPSNNNSAAGRGGAGAGARGGAGAGAGWGQFEYID